MKTMTLIRPVVRSLLILILSTFVVSHVDGRTLVPGIATICGVGIGYDTMDTLEGQIGHGLPEMGGHPNSGRRWRCNNCDISADAFYYYDGQGHADGAVIDFLSITSLSHDPAVLERLGENTLPIARLAPKQTHFLGIVSLGMTKMQVLRALSSRIAPPEDMGTALVWNAAGYVRVRSNIVMTSWRAQLRFESDKLQEIRIESSINRGKAGLDLRGG